MEKVKLTQEQADAIERLLEKGSRDEILDTHFNIDSWQYPENRCLNGMEASHLARALYIGYEVEPKFKVRDWVYNKNADVFLQIDDKDMATRYSEFPSIYRHATPEEIAKEKQRIWWAKHDRGVWELREGDALKADDGDYLVEVCEVFDSCNVRLTGGVVHVKISELKEGYRVICFAEDRKDLGDD